MKLNLDLTNVSSSGGGDDLLPAGTYTGRITDTKLIETGNGHALKVVFNVTQGDCEGQQFSDFLNIINSNETAQKIAQGTIKRIMECGGHANPGALADSEELHGLMMTVRLAQEPNYKDPSYTDNVIKGYNKVQEPNQSAGAMKTTVENLQKVFPEAKVEVITKNKLPWE